MSDKLKEKAELILLQVDSNRECGKADEFTVDDIQTILERTISPLRESLKKAGKKIERLKEATPQFADKGDQQRVAELLDSDSIEEIETILSFKEDNIELAHRQQYIQMMYDIIKRLPTDTVSEAGKQRFDNFPKLAEYIERIASTGQTLSMSEWGGFLRELNKQLSTPHITDMDIIKYLQSEQCKIDYPNGMPTGHGARWIREEVGSRLGESNLATTRTDTQPITNEK